MLYRYLNIELIFEPLLNFKHTKFIYLNTENEKNMNEYSSIIRSNTVLYIMIVLNIVKMYKIYESVVTKLKLYSYKTKYNHFGDVFNTNAHIKEILFKKLITNQKTITNKILNPFNKQTKQKKLKRIFLMYKK